MKRKQFLQSGVWHAQNYVFSISLNQCSVSLEGRIFSEHSFFLHFLAKMKRGANVCGKFPPPPRRASVPV